MRNRVITVMSVLTAFGLFIGSVYCDSNNVNMGYGIKLVETEVPYEWGIDKSADNVCFSSENSVNITSFDELHIAGYKLTKNMFDTLSVYDLIRSIAVNPVWHTYIFEGTELKSVSDISKENLMNLIRLRQDDITLRAIGDQTRFRFAYNDLYYFDLVLEAKDNIINSKEIYVNGNAQATYVRDSKKGTICFISNDLIEHCLWSYTPFDNNTYQEALDYKTELPEYIKFNVGSYAPIYAPDVLGDEYITTKYVPETKIPMIYVNVKRLEETGFKKPIPYNKYRGYYYLMMEDNEGIVVDWEGITNKELSVEDVVLEGDSKQGHIVCNKAEIGYICTCKGITFWVYDIENEDVDYDRLEEIIYEMFDDFIPTLDFLEKSNITENEEIESSETILPDIE